MKPNRPAHFVFLVTLFLCVSLAKGQGLNFTSVFRPKLSMFYEEMPRTALNDSVSFRSGEYSFSGLIPLRVSASAKKLKPKVKIDMLSIAAGVRSNEIDGLEGLHKMGRLSIGYTGVRAGIGRGVWVYILNAGISADLAERDKNFPYLTAAFGKVNILGVRRQNLFGAGIYAGRGLIVPFPVIGFNRMFSAKSGMVTVLPVYWNYWFAPVPKLKFSAGFSLGGFNNAFTPGIPTTLPSSSSDPMTLRIGYARTGLRLDWKAFSNFWFSAEGGGDFFKKVSFVQNREVIYSDRIPVQPYAKAGFTWRIPRREDKIPWPEF